MATPAGIRIAQTVGITSAGFVAGTLPHCLALQITHISLPGGTLCISYLYIPSLLLSPYPLVVRQWQKSFDIGKVAHQIVAAISMGAYGYLAYQMKGTLDQHKAELYGICALFNFFIWPWTILVTMPTNMKLFKKHDECQAAGWDAKVNEDGVSKEQSSHELIRYWSNLNIVRGCFPLLAAALGVWATVS